MPIAVTEDHESLRLTVRRWAETHCPPDVPRAVAEAAAPDLPAVWEKLGAQGWLGLHLPELHGGQGFTVAELAVVLEELGHALVPGPLLPTVLVSNLVAAHAEEALQAELLPGLADGTITAAVAPSGGGVHGARADHMAVRLTGTARPLLGLPTARLVLVPAALEEGATLWCLIDRELGGAAGPVEPLPALDGTRTLGCLDLGPGITVDARHHFALPDGEVRGLLLALAAAESAGIARWCLETASDHAKLRVQFGRPIGQFQAVKHALADMLVAVEQGASVAWDAATAWSEERPDERGRDLSAHIAGAIGLEAAAHCAKQCIQILGGIGFTWEHDAHLYLKRAMANLQLAAAGDVDALEHEVAALAVAGARRHLAADLPPEAGSVARRDPRRRGRGRRRPRGRPARCAGRGGPDHAALAVAVGTGRLAPRAAGHRRRAVRRRRRPPAPRRGGVGTADPHRVRVRGAAGALGQAHTARTPQLVPALQRTRRGVRPRRTEHEGGPRGGRLDPQRAEGVDIAGPDG